MHWVAVFCFVALFTYLAVGERIVALRDLDPAQARRLSLALTTALGGLGFAFLQPMLWLGFGRAVLSVLHVAGATGTFAAWLDSPAFTSALAVIGMGLFVVFAVLALAVGFGFLTGRLT